MADLSLPEGWMRYESRSKKGKQYYFNVLTGESSWSFPSSKLEDGQRNKADSKERKNSEPVNVSITRNVDVADRGPPPHPPWVDPTQVHPHPPPLGMPFQGTMVQQSTPVAPSQSSQQCSTSTSGYSNQMYNRPIATPLSPPSLISDESSALMMDADMECDERWEGTNEVDMDIDMSDQMQQRLVIEVKSMRSNVQPHYTNQREVLQHQTSNELSYQDKLYLVLDTNILLSHLEFLVELKDYAIKGVGRPVLVIPWVVMQELDGLKNKPDIGVRARRGISFLHSCFEAQHPRVRGQTMEEVQTELTNLAIENNDDKILHCCLVYQHKTKDLNCLVVLFSNDTQLCSKAFINGVKAVNRKTLLSELRNLCRHLKSDGKVASYTHTTEYAEKVTEQVQVEIARAVTDDIICEAESLLRDGLSAVIEKEMTAVYELLWLDVIAIKPPWTFQAVLQLLEKHWIAVFSFFVHSKAKEHLSQLIHHMKKKESAHSSHLVAQSLLENGMEFVKYFITHSNYNGILTHCLAALKVLQKKLSEISGNVDKSDGDTVVSSVHPVGNNQSEVLSKLALHPPAQPLEKVPWSLGVVYEGVKVYSEHIASSARQRKKIGRSLEDLKEMLEKLFKQLSDIVAAITNYLCALPSPSIPIMQDVVMALNSFMIEIFAVSSPLNIDIFYTYSSQTDCSTLFQRALTEFNSSASLLRKLAVQHFS